MQQNFLKDRDANMCIAYIYIFVFQVSKHQEWNGPQLGAN